jgi:hypothetical protein
MKLPALKNGQNKFYEMVNVYFVLLFHAEVITSEILCVLLCLWVLFVQIGQNICCQFDLGVQELHCVGKNCSIVLDLKKEVSI